MGVATEELTTREVLEAIADANAGVLTPALVVDTARDPGHPLHPKFEWDDAKAGEEYRRVQARTLIRLTVTQVPAPGSTVAVPLRTFVSVPTDRGGTTTGVYRRLSDVLADPKASAAVLGEVKARLRGLRQTYGHLSALDRVWGAVDEVAG